MYIIFNAWNSDRPDSNAMPTQMELICDHFFFFFFFFFFADQCMDNDGHDAGTVSTDGI